LKRKKIGRISVNGERFITSLRYEWGRTKKEGQETKNVGGGGQTEGKRETTVPRGQKKLPQREMKKEGGQFKKKFFQFSNIKKNRSETTQKKKLSGKERDISKYYYYNKGKRLPTKCNWNQKKGERDNGKTDKSTGRKRRRPRKGW